MKYRSFLLGLLYFACGFVPGLVAEDHPTIAKGSAGKGEAVASHPPAKRGDSNKTRYDFQMVITGREGDTFTAIITEPAARGRQAMEAKLKGELVGKNEVALEVVGMDRGVWFPYIPKKLSGKIDNGKIYVEWSRNDRQPTETKGALEAVLTLKK